MMNWASGAAKILNQCRAAVLGSGGAEGYMQTLCISRSTLVPASTERQTRLALSAVVLPAFDTPETFRFLDILVSQRTSV
jgi:hypothetical protein